MVVFILGTTQIVGCTNSDYKPTVDIIAEEQEQKTNIQIETNEVTIKAEGLELLGVQIVDDGGLFNIVTSIKNNSNQKYDALKLNMKFYDQTGAVIGSSSDIGREIESGEVWKSNLLESDEKGIVKIKVMEISVIGNSDNQKVLSKDEFEEIVAKCAQTLVYENIKSPATAQWVSADILEKDEYGRYLVDVVLDAQNGFGALIRSGFIVALKSVEEGGNFTHSSMFFMEEYSRDFERTQAIEYIKNMNNSGETKVEDEEIKEDLTTENNDSTSDTEVNNEDFKISSSQAISIIEDKTGFQYASAYDNSTGQYDNEPEVIQIFGTFCWIVPVIDPTNPVLAEELYVDANSGIIYNEVGETPWNEL